MGKIERGIEGEGGDDYLHQLWSSPAPLTPEEAILMAKKEHRRLTKRYSGKDRMASMLLRLREGLNTS